MTYRQEAASWLSPHVAISGRSPVLNERAPSTSALPCPTQPTMITFLRHCGCPFAEKAFQSLYETATSSPSIAFIAISHSSKSATGNWLASLSLSPLPSNMRVMIDEKKEIYAAWGLGASSWSHVLSPSVLYQVWKLGKEEGIWNRPTESGSRWQTAGIWGIDGDGTIRWGGIASSADDIANFEEGVRVLIIEAGARSSNGHESKL